MLPTTHALAFRVALVTLAAASGCSSLEPRTATPYRAAAVDPVADTEDTLAEVAPSSARGAAPSSIT